MKKEAIIAKISLGEKDKASIIVGIASCASIASFTTTTDNLKQPPESDDKFYAIV